MKAKAKREGPVKVNLGFDEAIQRALQVKPPGEGWAAYEAKLKRRSERKRRQKSRTR